MILSNNLIKRIVTLILFLLIGLSVIYGSPTFDSSHLKTIYNILPKPIQDKIANNSKDSLLDINSYFSNQKIVVCYNNKKQIAHLGINLTILNLVENKRKIENNFLETFILYILFSKNNDTNVIDYINHYQIEAFINGKQIQKKNLLDWQVAATKLTKTKITIKENINRFYAIGNNDIIIKFPANINLVSGKDKAELEQMFIRELSIVYRNPHKTTYATGKLKSSNDLYIVRGDIFETDNFNNDVFLTKKNNLFVPVFTNNFPKESFANLFTTDIRENQEFDATFVLYGNKKDKRNLYLYQIRQHLGINTTPYVGISKLSNDSIQGTIIYYNSTYNYIHMVIINAHRNEFFLKNNHAIKATIYLYIPRTNLSTKNRKKHEN